MRHSIIQPIQHWWLAFWWWTLKLEWIPFDYGLVVVGRLVPSRDGCCSFTLTNSLFSYYPTYTVICLPCSERSSWLAAPSVTVDYSAIFLFQTVAALLYVPFLWSG
jgi:hypothetical protein